MSAADPQRYPEAEDKRRLRPAGFWIRFAAQFLDGLILIPFALAGSAGMLLKSLPLAIVSCVPHLFYKPIMESFFGATLGKMICGVRVMDANGNKLGLGVAYVRSVFFVISQVLSIASYVWLFSQPEFLAEQDYNKANFIVFKSPFFLIGILWFVVIVIDCVTVAFTDRKRAIHDMMAGSYCVWKSTAPLPPEDDEPWEYDVPRQ